MALDVVAVDRAMAAAAPPTFTEVGALVGAESITITERLNAPEQLTFQVPADSQASEIKTRFRDPVDGTEVWVHDRDTGNRLFAGGLLGYQPRLREGSTLWAATAAGIFHYATRWWLEPDGPSKVYSGVDQALIAKDLIDYWQALSYGDYGIDTSSVVATGVTRDRSYFTPEAHNIAQRIQELSAVDNGFDFAVNPSTRELEIFYPFRGTDQTGTLIIDRRSIINPESMISVGPDDILSEAYAVSDTGLVSHAVDAAMRAKYGRAGKSFAYSGISEQATLDDHAQLNVDQRGAYLHSLGVTSYPVAFDWSDFAVGDIVEYAFDHGAGTVVEQRRVLERKLTESSDGNRQITVVLL